MKRKLWIILALTVLASVLLCGSATADSMAFISQPSCGDLDAATRKYPISWETNFTPYKVEIRRNNFIGDDKVIATLETGLTAQYTYWLSGSYGGDTIVVKAYYGSGASKTSSDLYVSPPSPDFTSYPACGNLNAATRKYPISWETNFTPYKVEIRRNNFIGDDKVIATLETGLTPQYTYWLNGSYGGDTIVVKAYYGSSACRTSIDLYVSPPSTAFVTQPSCGDLDAETKKYPITWKTGFIPYKIEIRRNNFIGDDKVIATLENALTPRYTYWLSGSYGGDTIVVKAYYGNSACKTSIDLFVSPPSPEFTSYPSCGDLNAATKKYPISWETNFTPYKVEIRRNNFIGDDKVIATLETGLTPQYTYWLNGAYGGDTIVVKAYYGSSACRTSSNLYVSPQRMTVTFDPNGGELDVTSAETGLNGKLESLPVPVRAGYNFIGWYRVENGVQRTVNIDTVYYIHTTITAHWVPAYHTITVIDGTASAATAYTGQRSLTLAANEKPGMRFHRWVVVYGEATIHNVYNPNSTFVMGPENLTVQATYLYLPRTVTFDARGGEVSPATAQTNGSAKLAKLPTPTREGYNFNYWYMNTANGGTAMVTTNTVFLEDTTVYASWSGVWHSITVLDGTANYSAAPATRTVTVTANQRDNFTFSHWEVVSGDAVFNDPTTATATFVMGIEPATVRAYYTYSGERMTEAYVYVSEPEPGAHPAAPVVTSDAYSVNSYLWYDTSDNTQLTETDVFENGKSYRLDLYLRITGMEQIFDPSVVGYVNGSTEGVTTTYQAYLQTRIEKTFTVASYTVSFDANGGTGEMDAVTGVGMAYTLPACGFTPPEDHVFDGWDCGSPGEIVAMTGDRTVTAQWRRIGGSCGADVTWRLYDDGTLVISGTGSMANYATTTAERAPWFSQRQAITAVVIEDGVTQIGTWSFYYCDQAVSVSLPDGMAVVGTGAFFACSALENLTLPEGVTTVGGNAFKRCGSLTSITVPETMSYLGSYAFDSCNALTDVYVLSPETAFGTSVFNAHSGTLQLHGFVGSTAEEYADGFDYIDFVPFPYGGLGEDVTWTLSPSGALTIRGTGPMYAYASVTESPLYAFRDQIRTAEIGDGVTTIGKHVFGGCSALKEISIPDSVSALGENAFLNCSSLDHVRIPYGVTEIQGFRGCTSLSDITLPYSVVLIRMNAFYGCTGLTSLDFIPESVRYIRSYAFCGCTGLTSVFFPRGVTAIEYNVFRSCSNLTSIAIHHDVTAIQDNAFYGANSLTSVYYEGVRFEWDAISIAAQGNAKLLNAAVYCKSAVVFDSRGGTAVSMQALDYEECAMEPEEPIRYGYLFGGWYPDEDCTGEAYDFSAPVTGDVTLYALWIDPAPDGMLKLPASLAVIEGSAFSGVAAEAVIIPNTVVSIAGNPFAGSGVRYIYGMAGSLAEDFAAAWPEQYTFVLIDDAWLASH